MHTLAKIKSMSIATLHPGTEGKDIATRLSSSAFQILEQRFSNPLRTACLICDQIVHIATTALISILNNAPQGHTKNLIAIRRHAHPRAAAKHLGQASGIICRK